MLIPKDKVGQAKRWAEFHWTSILYSSDVPEGSFLELQDTSVRIQNHNTGGIDLPYPRRGQRRARPQSQCPATESTRSPSVARRYDVFSVSPSRNSMAVNASACWSSISKLVHFGR